MNRSLVCTAFIILLAAGHSTHAQQDIGYVEKFALADDRTEALKQLVPGTEEYYYYHALHYQNTDQLSKVDKLLEPWIKRFGQTQQVKLIRNRQALLKYDDNPKLTFDFLASELKLNFNHQRRIPRTERDLPTKLDPSLIASQRLIQAAIGRHRNTDGFEESGLSLLAGDKLDNVRRRHLLSRLSYPDFPNLVKLVVTDLRERDSGGFGSLGIHSNLTIDQLDQCAKELPKLLDNENYIYTYMGKLYPDADKNWTADRNEHRQYLMRLWAFASKLSPAHNSLKACILYRRLELDRLDGKYDNDLFMEYLNLPRQIVYVNPQLIKQTKSSSYIVNLGADYSSRIQLVPIYNDEPLVRHYLHHFLVNANNFDAFRPFIRESYLKEQFASVKIVNGLGDIEKWASMLTPDQYRQLVDRVDLDFVPTSREFFEDDQTVEIELFTKNIDKLIVKVFEINTFNFYRNNETEIDTNVNLDGLVPNSEKTYQYNEPPALRKKRSFKFEQLTGPGVYVVDFIAGGESSRALIRRGRLSMVDQPTVAGQQFRIYDQNRQQVNDASLWIAGRKYVADEKTGFITIPFSTQPTRRNAIITRGNFSSLQSFNQLGENYLFDAGIYVDRESLLINQKAQLLIRPSLRVVGLPTSVRFLEDVQLAITSVNQDGISTTKLVDNLKLADKEETTSEFMVPARLSSITFTLSAKIKNLSRNETQTVSTSRTFEINSIDKTDEIQDVHLMPAGNGYQLEVRGKTGELRQKQAVRLELKHRDFKNTVSVDLQSDEAGMINLGPLTNITLVKATTVGGTERAWGIDRGTQSYARTVNAQVGKKIEIPLPTNFDKLSRDSASLFELRNKGRFTKDWFDKMSAQDGLLLLEDLPPGDFLLRFKPNGKVISIRVADGQQDDDVVLGKYRQLEIRDAKPLVIQRVSASDERLDVQLANASPMSRVHVIASRYQPRFNSYREFARVKDAEPWSFQPSIRRSVYMTGRKIGDEYQYILDRKYAKKYAGNMLDRASLLIAPWAWRETSNNVETLRRGGEFGEAGNESDGSVDRMNQERQQGSGYSDFANLDYLLDQSVVLRNLEPDKNGTISIDRKQIGNHQYIRVVALDRQSTIEKTVSLAGTKTDLRDLRLAHALDPEKHYSQSKQIETLAKGKTLSIDDLISAKFQYFDDIGDVYRLFLVLNPKTELLQFEFLLTWSDKPNEEKQELYSKHACHELNFYLMKKDKAFFNRVVRANLQSKRERTFMDDYLVADDLRQYLDPWRYARLNIFERILLSQRLEKQSADIVRNIQDQYLLAPTLRGQFDTIFDVAIRSNNLYADTGVALDALFDKNSESEGLPSLAFELQSKSRAASDEKSARGRYRVPAAPPAAGLRKRGALGDKMQREERSDDSSENSLLAGNKFKETAQDIRSRRQLGKKGARSITARPADQPGSGGGGGAGGLAGEIVDFDDEADARFEAQAVELRELREKVVSLYRRLPPTSEWIEHNYFHTAPATPTVDFVQTNRFWRDYSNHAGGTFLSPYFAESHRSLTEMMFALAVLDLPEKAAEHQFDYADGSMTLKAGGPMITFHQQVRPAILNRGNTTILISENFYQKNDRFRHEDGIQYDKFIIDKFLAHSLYGGQVVITNPTSTPSAVELLIQIPKGSVAASGSQETRTIQLQLDAFSTKTFDYYFYFPTAGNFDHYPAHVSSDEKVLAVADPVAFKVTDEPAAIDKTSWEFVSQNGTADEVLDFLSENNVLRFDLSQIAFRMKDAGFFKRVINALRNRYVYNHVLWSYAIKHQDQQVSREFLSHEDRICNNVGIYFESPLLTINPLQRLWFQQREFSPLVNARFHQVGANRKILNPQIHEQYHRLMDILASRNTLTHDDNLVVTYYMLLQDRIDEALKHFERVNRDELDSKMQYEYCSAYLDMYLEKPDDAAAKAEKWVSYPVDLWRNRFKNILAQVEEIRGGATSVVDDKDNSQKQTELAAQAASFDFDIESKKIVIKGQNLSKVTVNFYEMDIELLFSRSPFAQDNFDGFSVIRPNITRKVKLDADKAIQEIELPAELDNKNVLVEIEAGDQVKSKPYFANSLAVQTIERYGQMKVTETATNKAVPKSYVKVYARSQNGQVRFHKDGYTDLRGRFDYVSQSNNPLDDVAKYSVLVLSPDYGAIIRQVAPPAE